MNKQPTKRKSIRKSFRKSFRNQQYHINKNVNQRDIRKYTKSISKYTKKKENTLDKFLLEKCKNEIVYNSKVKTYDYYNCNTLDFSNTIEDDKNIYELVYIDNRKYKYFIDIDNYEFNRNTLTELLDFLLEIMIKEFNNEFIDYVVLTNEYLKSNLSINTKKNDRFDSIHIIYNFVLDKQSAKNFGEYINNLLLEKYGIIQNDNITKAKLEVDMSVYSKNRKFRQINQSKENKSKKNKLIPIDNTKFILDYIITANISYPLYKFNKIINNPIIEENKNIIQDNNINNLNDINNSRNLIIIDKDNVENIFIKKYNVISYILDNINDSVYIDTYDWLNMSKVIIGLFSYTNRNKELIEKFIKYYNSLSIKKAIQFNKHYDYNKNNKELKNFIYNDNLKNRKELVGTRTLQEIFYK